MSYYLRFAAYVVAVIAVALLSGACSDDSSEQAQTEAAETVQVESRAADTSLSAVRSDTLDAPGAPVTAETRLSPELIDSLRAQLASIEGLIAGLGVDSVAAADAAVAARRKASGAVAAADTAAVVEPAKALKGVRNLGLRFFWAIVVIAITVLFLRAVVWILERSAERIVTRRLFFKKLIPGIRIVTWLTTLFIIVRYVFDIGGSELVAAGAAVGVAIGFAAQDVLKNIFGGILIILDQPFQVGDKINVGGTYGEVVSIGLRSTRIVTPDDNLVTVPNTQVVDGQVANANAGALDCQVVTDLYLPGWVDVSKAKEIAFNAAANSKYIYLQKPVVVLVKDEFKETFLTHVQVKAYVLDTRYEAVFASDITETAKSEYLRLGMLYPFAPPISPLVDENGTVETPAST